MTIVHKVECSFFLFVQAVRVADHVTLQTKKRELFKDKFNVLLSDKVETSSPSLPKLPRGNPKTPWGNPEQRGIKTHQGEENQLRQMGVLSTQARCLVHCPKNEQYKLSKDDGN